MKIWIDITNTPHVNVLLPVIRHFNPEYEIFITARNFSETVPLLRKNGVEPIILGEYKGKSRIRKGLGMIMRSLQIFYNLPPFDISIALGGNYTATISHFKKKPSIVFSDNDISFKAPAYRWGSEFIFPSYFDYHSVIEKHGVDPHKIHTFDGFKEDIYIADYHPDPRFLESIPFKNFITIRPENLKASYVPPDSKTIVPELFEKFRDTNILYLPRYEEEKDYAKGYNNIFIPPGPLNGLDVCHYSLAMLTGAGTFAREAALLGTPAVSFFPGNHFLTVDKIMQDKGWEFKSRNPEEIYQFVKSSEKRPSQQYRSLKVQTDVFSIIQKILEKYK